MTFPCLLHGLAAAREHLYSGLFHYIVGGIGLVPIFLLKTEGDN